MTSRTTTALLAATPLALGLALAAAPQASAATTPPADAELLVTTLRGSADRVTGTFWQTPNAQDAIRYMEEQPKSEPFSKIALDAAQAAAPGVGSFAEAVVPRVTVVTRKTYGGAYIAMNSRALGATAVFAWPGSEVAVMGAKAAVGILHKKALAAAPDDEREALHDRLAAEHEAIAGGVGRAQSIGVVDEIIDPAHTRSIIAEALAAAPARRGRHKNIPL